LSNLEQKSREPVHRVPGWTADLDRKTASTIIIIINLKSTKKIAGCPNLVKN